MLPLLLNIEVQILCYPPNQTVHTSTVTVVWFMQTQSLIFVWNILVPDFSLSQSSIRDMFSMYFQKDVPKKCLLQPFKKDANDKMCFSSILLPEHSVAVLLHQHSKRSACQTDWQNIYFPRENGICLILENKIIQFKFSPGFLSSSSTLPMPYSLTLTIARSTSTGDSKI